MPSDSIHSKPFKQSVVRSLRHAWSTLTKREFYDETKVDPFASTWGLADERAINRKTEGFTDLARRSALASSSLDSLPDILTQFPLPKSIKRSPDELTSFLPSFDSPPSSPRSSTSHEVHSLDSNQIMSPSSETGCPEDRSSHGSIFLDLIENYSGCSSLSSSNISQSSHNPTLELSTSSVTSIDSNKKAHRARPSIDVRMVSDFGPASIRCWRPLSWSGLLGVVSLRTKRPKHEIAFVCENYPNVISTEEEYDAMIAWLLASRNDNSHPKFDLWVVNKTLTSGRMHIGRYGTPRKNCSQSNPDATVLSSPGPRAQSSSGFLRATPPRKQLRRAATTLMSSPRISEAPPLSWKLGMSSMEYSESNSTDNTPRGWI